MQVSVGVIFRKLPKDGALQKTGLLLRNLSHVTIMGIDDNSYGSQDLSSLTATLNKRVWSM